MCTIWTRRNARVNLREASLRGAILLFHVPSKRRERACHPERRRREGPAFRERRTSDAKDLSFVRADRKQVLRSRACRALAQDDNAASLRKRKKGSNGGSLERRRGGVERGASRERFADSRKQWARGCEE